MLKKWNSLPNLLTFGRIVLNIPFIYFLLQPDCTSRIIAVVVFAVAAYTDYLDGVLARSMREVSRLGNFMDPLADKILVACGFIGIVLVEPEVFPLWMIVIIILREVGITILRISAISHAKDVKTLYFGKSKAAMQYMTIIITLGLIILKSYVIEESVLDISYQTPLTRVMAEYYQNTSLDAIQHLPIALLIITFALTVISGIQYLIVNWNLIINKSNNNKIDENQIK